MASREKKPLNSKQLGVRKESDKVVKVAEASKEEDVSNKTRDSKQVQKDVNQGKKCIHKKRSTGGIKSRKSLESTEVTVKYGASSAVDCAMVGKPGRSSQNPKLRRINKLNKTAISQSGTNLANELLCHSTETKRSQSPRLCKTNKVSKGGKQGSRTLEETTVSDDSNLNTLNTKAQSPKLRRFAAQNKVGTGSPDVRNGTKVRNTPYVTRSDSPARVLRNGKRRKLKDPSLLEGLDVGYPKRRRLLSITRDGSGSDLGGKSETCLDDQSSIAGSDSSVYDFPRLENGKGNWDSDCDSRVPVDDTKNEERSASEAFSLPNSENQSRISHDSCLGKSISNKIAELIHRNKLTESTGKELVPRGEEKLVFTKPSESEEASLEKCIENEKNLMDTNFNLCEPESLCSEKTNCKSIECELSRDFSNQNISSGSEVSETKETVEHVLPTPRKVTVQDNAELKELGHKNGHNLSVDTAVCHPREKSVRKVRDMKALKTKKFIQECPSSSGVFFVVQNPINIPLQKEGARSVLTASSGEHQSSLTCTATQLANMGAAILNSSVEEKQSSDIENVASVEGGISSVSVRDVVKDTLNICAGIELEKESASVFSQTLTYEADVSSVNDSDTGVTITGKEDCVFNSNIDGKGCKNIDSEMEYNNKIDLGSTDDGSTGILDGKVDCKSDIKTDSKNSNKITSVDCENTVTHDVVTDTYDSNRIVIDNNDPVSTGNGAAGCMKTVCKDDCVMDTNIKKDCKETVCDVDMKVDYNESADPSSGTNFKDMSDSVVDRSECSSVNNKPQKLNFHEIPEATNNVKAALETLIHNDCESGASEAGKNVRRSTRSSVGKVRAAMLHCMTTGRMKSSKLDLQEKSQECMKDEAESLTICLAESGSTVVHEDVTFSARKTSELKGKQNDVEDKNANVKELERKADPVFAEADSSDKTEELLLHNSTTGVTAQSVPSKQCLFHKHDVHMKEEAEALSEEMGTSVCVDGVVGGKKDETSGTLLNVKMFQESVGELEKTDKKEIISDQDKKERSPQPKTDTSDMTDFIDLGTEEVVHNEDSFEEEPVKKETSEVTHNSESYTKLKVETDNKLPLQRKFMSNIVTHMKRDKEGKEEDDDKKDEMNNFEGGLIHKLQSGIEPTMFYAKENMKDVVFHDTGLKSSDIVVNDMKNNMPESQYDCKEQQVSVSAKEEFPSITSGCSIEGGQAKDSTKHVNEEITHKEVTVEQCHKVSEDGAVGIMSEVEQFEVEDSLHKASSSIDGVGTSSLDTEETDSKVSDLKTKFMEEEVSPEEQAIKESVLSALGLQPLRVTQVLYVLALSEMFRQLTDVHFVYTAYFTAFRM